MTPLKRLSKLASDKNLEKFLGDFFQFWAIFRCVFGIFTQFQLHFLQDNCIISHQSHFGGPLVKFYPFQRAFSEKIALLPEISGGKFCKKSVIFKSGITCTIFRFFYDFFCGTSKQIYLGSEDEKLLQNCHFYHFHSSFTQQLEGSLCINLVYQTYWSTKLETKSLLI